MRRKKKHDEIDGRWVEEPTRVKGELKKKKEDSKRRNAKDIAGRR